jgi:hypothetical protein
MTLLSDMGELYRSDLALWAAQQAEALRSAARAGNNAAVDWANVAEEIESLGASERRSLASHIRTVIEHLMKLQASPAEAPRPGWRETILRARRDIEDVLEESPSLRRDVTAIIFRQTEKTRRDVSVILKDHGEDASALVGLTYDEDRVLGPFLPD